MSAGSESGEISPVRFGQYRLRRVGPRRGFLGPPASRPMPRFLRLRPDRAGLRAVVRKYGDVFSRRLSLPPPRTRAARRPPLQGSCRGGLQAARDHAGHKRYAFEFMKSSTKVARDERFLRAHGYLCVAPPALCNGCRKDRKGRSFAVFGFSAVQTIRKPA